MKDTVGNSEKNTQRFCAPLRVRILMDNLASGGLACEWGFSALLTYGGMRLLLDTGADSRFAENADALGINLAAVDLAVLSHAHYDHANGMPEFFARNARAPFYVRAGAAEDCWSDKEHGMEYIGICPGTLQRYSARIRCAAARECIAPGVYLLAHSTPGLAALGAAARLYRKAGEVFVPDDFSHEQSLVLRTPNGLAVFNSCCHGGADNIIREVCEAFPGERVAALVGGFHLFRSDEETVRAFARRVRDTGIARVVTGHCTGQAAYEILRGILGAGCEQMYAGMDLTLGDSAEEKNE